MNLLLSFESICILLLPQVLLVFGIQEIHADQEMIVKISAAGQLMQCSASVDILFLLDGSYSIGKGSFERSKHFTGKLCDALDISPDRVRVGMIQFSSTPRLEFSLDSYRTKQEVKERIKKTMFRHLKHGAAFSACGQHGQKWKHLVTTDISSERGQLLDNE